MSYRRHNQTDLFKEIYLTSYSQNNLPLLQRTVKDNKSTVQRLRLLRKLPVHNGCVNTISWSENGDHILSGSDDQKLCVTDANTYKSALTVQTGHRANIFSAKFLPNCGEKQVVSCSGDGIIMYTNLDRPEECIGNSFNCHFGTAYKVITVPNDPNIFMSCGEDGTVRWFDLRVKQSCHAEDCREDILLNCRKAVTALAINPLSPYEISVGSADSYVQIYDRRMIGTRATGNFQRENTRGLLTRFTVPSFENKAHRITSLVYSADAAEMLISYSSEYLYLFKLKGNRPTEVGELAGGSLNSLTKSKNTPPPLKRLRLRGDWSDTGPNARPERELPGSSSNQRSTLHTTLMQRMSDVLTRMLNQPPRNRRTAREDGNPTLPERDVESAPSAPGGGGESSDDTILGVWNPGTSQDSSSGFHNPETDPVVLVTAVQEVSSEEDTVDRSSQPPASESQSSEPLPSSEPERKNSIPETGSSDMPENVQLTVPSDAGACEMPVDKSEKTVHVEEIMVSAEVSAIKAEQPTVAEVPPQESSDSAVEASVSIQDVCREAVLPQKASPPGEVVLQESVKSLEEELSARRKQFMERTKQEPVVNLHYSAQGVSSGQISMEMGSTISHNAIPPGSIDSDSQTLQGPPIAMTVMTTIPKIPPADTSSQESGVLALSSERTTTSVDLDEQVARSSSSLVSGVITSGESVSMEIGSTADDSIDNNDDDSSESSFSSDDEEEPRPWRRKEEFRSTSRTRSNSSHDSDNVTSADDEIVVSPSEDNTESQPEKSCDVFPPPRLLYRYKGHRNARTMIKEANFWGDKFVMSGSDCGHIFFWDRRTTEVVMILEADQHVVNCIQPHPFDPVLASSGIDYDVKLWAPLHEEPSFDDKTAAEIMRRNEVMLEETRDTITVPASFMIRMLASLNHLRTGGARARPSRPSEQPPSD